MSLIFYFSALLSGATAAATAIHPTTLPAGFFHGPQTGIGSWYQANKASDHTNGKSWCGYSYANSDPLFAVSLKAMGGATYSKDPAGWRAATRKYCGLEAKLTDPSTGKSTLVYIGDAFDDRFVRTPASIDIMLNSFIAVHGDPKGNKNIVIKDAHWEFTGNVNTKYMAP
ncbi:hypothetical protein PT974_10908 [Cladobotryum mycophilum]|uniref:Uncharacterized protein n=1 Tax=Cladobotryum mycophilum TaxID=491253 RepID=A0ABR0SBQ0_9HYPO